MINDWEDIQMAPAYKRILLKISGESLAGPHGQGICNDTLHRLGDTIHRLSQSGVEIGIVVGGGNFWRGRASRDMDRVTADHMGMLATTINALALSDALEQAGAVTRVLDIYRWFTPHIALIAPDIYIADSRGYEAICAGYARDDNPLFVPESAPAGSNAWNMFRAIADYDAVGYHIFGVEHVMGEDGNVSPETQELVDSFRCVSAAIPLLLKYQGTDRVHALIQEENLWSQRLDLGRYIALAQFGDGAPRRGAKDWRHRSERPAPVEGARRAPRARGLVFQVSDYEFYVVGGNYRLFFRPRVEPRKAVDSAIITPFLNTHMTHYVSVDEGHFDENGEYVVDRRRNGDEASNGVWVEPDTGVVRIVLCE